jgi:putative ABC transport system permease protein
VDSLLKDLTNALRTFRRNPVFVITAVAALALGMGANVAIFSVVDAVLLKPLAAPDPSKVVVFLATNRMGTGAIASDIKFNLWKEQTDVFEDVSGYYRAATNVTSIDAPERASVMFVTGDYFRLFGLPLARGRSFSADEERPNGRQVVILSNAFWKRTFGADTRIAGKSIALGKLSYEVIGVMADGIRVENGEPPDLWLPFPIDPNSNNQVHYFQAVGRLRPRVTLARANAQLQLTTQEFRRRYPNGLSTARGDIFSVQPLRDFLVKDARTSLLTLTAAVGLVLLIACANVANLLLMRSAGRKREIAVRVAVGASRGRIVRQLLTESLLLSTAGAVCGLGIGAAGIHMLLTLNAVNIPRLGMSGQNVAMDWRVVAFTVTALLVTALLFGSVPALRASRADLNCDLKEGGAHSGRGFRRDRLRSLLAISEMSIAILLLIGAALLIRTLIALRSVNPGFDPSHVVTTRVTLDPAVAKASGIDQIAAGLVRRVSEIAGVEGAALTTLVPLEGSFNSLTITIIGRPLTGLSHGNSRWMTVSPGYFDVLKIPLLRGRLFTEADRQGAPAVAIINQAMARQFWPDGDPLHQRLVIGRGLGQNFEEPEREVVGIVGDVHDDSLDRSPLPAVFVPLAQRPTGRATGVALLARTRERRSDGAIQSELRKATGLAVPPLRSMPEILLESTARQKFNMLLMSIFGALALVLAAIGIYGLMAYSVGQRTREIGIRMALGARASAVRNMVVFHGMRLALTGVAMGVAGALGLTRYLATFLFGVPTWDPWAFVFAPLLLTAVAGVAVWLPARAASRVDPIRVLRHE